MRRHMPRMACVWGWVAATLVLAAIPDQLTAQFTQTSPLLSGTNPIQGSLAGFRLYDVTGFAGWESVATPYGGYILPGITGLKADETYGGSVSLGWTHRRAKTNLYLLYTGSYLGRVQYSNWNALSHFLTLGASHQFGAKWSLSFDTSATISTYDQMLSSPTMFGSMAAAPGSFDDLASAVLAGKVTNDQLASLLTGVPVIESPSRTLFFGNRVFGASAAASARYARSQRLSFSLSTSASRAQHLNDPAERGLSSRPYLLQSALYGSAAVGMSYAATPRTEIGVSLSSSRSFSVFQQAYSTYGTASIGRTLGRHWFAQAHGGAGFVTNLRSAYRVNSGGRPLFGASLGYRAYANTLIASYTRTLGQAYGAGAVDTTSIMGAWNWWRPGRSWGLSSSYGREQLRDGAFGNVQGWRALIALTRHMGRHMMLETGYSYGSYSSHRALSPYQGTQSSVRVTVMWAPQPMGER
ncbi:MAG TPA: hypothetical protein VJN43_12305 [Bryobacteraceae bacterium]|nr:hypothetical protein [Bryobacteraceae bacterium]